MKYLVSLSLCLVLTCLGYPQQADDLDELLHSVKKLSGKEARFLLRKGIVANTATPRQELARRVSETLLSIAQTPEQIAEVLGPAKQVSRQVFYRGYREQWIYESPLAVLVVFDIRKGRDPKILEIRPMPSVTP